MDKPEITASQCAFVMLDALGFKHKLDGPDRREEFGKFTKIAMEMDMEFGAKMLGDISDVLKLPGQNFLLYSDTLIFWQVPTGKILPCDALVSAAAFAMRVIASSLEQGFLVRGAISYGEIMRSSILDSIAGPVVNECAKHYEIGQWVGCHVTPSGEAIIESAPQNKQDRVKSYFQRLSVPFVTKTDVQLESPRWAVNWLKRQAKYIPELYNGIEEGQLKTMMREYKDAGRNMSDAVLDYFKGLLHAYATANPKAERKVANTIRAMLEQ